MGELRLCIFMLHYYNLFFIKFWIFFIVLFKNFIFESLMVDMHYNSSERTSLSWSCGSCIYNYMWVRIPLGCTWYNIMWWSLSVIYDMLFSFWVFNTITCAISAYYSCEFESHSGVPGTTLCDEVCQWFTICCFLFGYSGLLH